MASTRRGGSNAGQDGYSIAYHAARGDELLQDTAFTHESIQRGLDILATKYGAGQLAYTPEVVEQFKEIYGRRYAVNDGPDQFQMPNYAPYVDKDIATFYGLDTSTEGHGGRIMQSKETFADTVGRILDESARETLEYLPGLQQMMDHYETETWARHGVADESPFAHENPDVTLFRNPAGGWSTIDRPAATSDKSNVIDMYNAVPNYTHPTPHPGWTVDRPGAFYDSLPNRDDVASGW